MNDTPGVLSVLVVDDQADVADSLAELVGLCGHAARAAYTAAGAILLASELVPDVVLTDLAMPHVDGLELAGWLRAQAPGAVVVAVTGWPERAAGGPFDWVLAKPVGPGALAGVLGDAAARRRRDAARPVT